MQPNLNFLKNKKQTINIIMGNLLFFFDQIYFPHYEDLSCYHQSLVDTLICFCKHW